jgi:hypothetical protein
MTLSTVSFTLCPSVHPSSDMANPPSEVPQHQIFQGALLKEFTLPSQSKGLSRIIRASPFEPLLHQRNLLDGTISPLQMDAHLKLQHRQRAEPIPSITAEDELDDSSIETTCSCNEDFPLTDVLIPLSTCLQRGIVELSATDWQSAYLQSNKSYEQLLRRTEQVTDENKWLKRQLIEMQRRVNQGRCIKRSSPWNIPEPKVRRMEPDQVQHSVSHDEKSATS